MERKITFGVRYGGAKSEFNFDSNDPRRQVYWKDGIKHDAFAKKYYGTGVILNVDWRSMSFPITESLDFGTTGGICEWNIFIAQNSKFEK